MITITLTQWFQTPHHVNISRSADKNCIYKVLNVPAEYGLSLSHNNYYGYNNHNNGITYYLTFYQQDSVYYKPSDTCITITDKEFSFVEKSENYYSTETVLQISNKELIISRAVDKLYTFKDSAPYICFLNFPLSLQIKDKSLETHVYLLSNLLGGNNEYFQEILNIDTNLALVLKSSKGVGKLFNKIVHFYNNLSSNTKKTSVKLLFDVAEKTTKGVKNSVVINKIFENVNTEAEFNATVDILEECFLNLGKSWRIHESFYEGLAIYFPSVRELRKEKLKKNQTKAFNKIMEDIDFININKEKYPLTFDLVQNGDIPLGTFFRKQIDSYFLYNDNWELWEAFVARFPTEAVELAKEVSRRTTYEKDIMSYFYFILHALPEYLEKYTGKKWTCSPKIVHSANELEPPKTGENGVAKTRSALTPTVDNEKNHVVVPYVSMSVGGYKTQFCYALDYNLFHRGMSYKGNVVVNEIEEKLNGRDDYGLMWYTLTGTDTARGYPTFLIIFERLDDSTRVHFHRTHPMRSKNGEYNPIHQWIKGCYRWMVGNVPFERITVQQGDLAFVDAVIDDDFSSAQEVNSFDNHCFERPVKYLPYTKRDGQNILGYFKLDSNTTLKHNEHADRFIPAGEYELRQCRSWEATPTGIWVLRID